MLASEMGNNTLTVLANGLHDGGCEFVSYFPGSVSHIVAERLGAKRISLNEKIAFEEAYGASLGGKRAVVCMKNVGLSVAADPFLNSHLTGVNAGLVIVVFDDVYVASSQSRQDSRHFLDFFGGLWLEPYNTETLYTSGYQALSLSEQLDIPVVIRLTNPLLSSEDNYTYPRKKKETLKFNYPIERQKFIVHPTNWQYQRQQLSLRLEKVQKYIEARYDSVLSNCSGEVENVVIVLGASSKNDIQLYRNWEQLQLSTYPLPYTTILKFIKNKKKIMIIEQGDDYAFQKIQLATGSRSNITSKTGFVPNLSGTYRNWSGLEKLFKGLKATNPSFVVSDLTQFTQETTNTINSCLCLGSSISVTIGLTEAAIPYPFCIIGDISFQHTGTDNVLYEARERGSRFGLIVIDNGGSWCTGGQKATYPLKDELHDWNLLTVDYENTSINQFSQIFNKFKSDNQLNILWVNYNNL